MCLIGRPTQWSFTLSAWCFLHRQVSRPLSDSRFFIRPEHLLDPTLRCGISPAIWVWVKIKPPGKPAGLGPDVQLPGLAPFGGYQLFWTTATHFNFGFSQAERMQVCGMLFATMLMGPLVAPPIGGFVAARPGQAKRWRKRVLRILRMPAC